MKLLPPRLLLELGESADYSNGTLPLTCCVSLKPYFQGSGSVFKVVKKKPLGGGC